LRALSGADPADLVGLESTMDHVMGLTVLLVVPQFNGVPVLDVAEGNRGVVGVAAQDRLAAIVEGLPSAIINQPKQTKYLIIRC
jgi:hypothetical protein